MTAAELAEWAYCPRAHYYHQHGAPRSPSGEAWARRGRWQHERTLAGWARETRPFPWWAVAAVGLAAIAIGVVWGISP